MEVECGRIVDDQKIEDKALAIPEQANALKVVDTDTLIKADEFLMMIKDVRKEVQDHFRPDIDKAYDLHKSLLAKLKKVLAPLLEAEESLKPQIATYMAAQERIRQEEEARVRREQEKIEEDRRLQEAEAAEEAGEHEEAAAIIEEPIHVPPPVVASPTPKTKASIRKLWRWRTTNIKLIPPEYMMVNEKAINGVVTSLKGATKIPGIEVYPVDSVAAGRR